MSRKSDTCLGKKSGKPVTEYDSQSDAQEGADYATSTYGRALVPYRCDKCNLWHLSPANRQTPSKSCGYCTGSDGKPKESYGSAQDAHRRADILRQEQGASLQVYECEYGSGWHLTRSARR
jgi:hypothetical protein